jgi:2-keto-3-deoxy-L-rhamnonate aldolase RhmA
MSYTLKQKIKAGKHVVGTMLCMTTSPNIVWVLKNLGFDFIFIDCEHGTYTMQEVSNIVSLCRALELGVIVRIPEPQRQFIQKYGDMGIDGIMLPMVEEVEQLEAANEFARYIPLGHRGMSLAATVDYKPVTDLREVISKINEDFIILAQIESQRGVENIENLLAVEGVDGIFFGVYDMSISYGKPGEIYHPMFREKIQSVLEAAKRHSKILGHHFFGFNDLEWGLSQGVQLIAWHTDTSALQKAYAEDLKKIREIPGYRM